MIRRNSTRETPPPAESAAGRGWFSPAPSLVFLAFSALFAWSYWPTILSLSAIWDKEPDYSHGYLVVPVALYFLWSRRGSCPSGLATGPWGGLSLMAISGLVRVGGVLFSIDSLDGYSLPLWLAGAVWFLGGARLVKWSLPSLGFLYFMVPLPFRVESLLSLPLQRVATLISCGLLQCLGQPAIAEGNLILLGDFELEVARACSGLRMFMGITALAVAYVVLVRRAAWQRLLLLASLIPISILANSVRITGTGLLYQLVSGEAAKTFSHDIAGWLMIPLAASLFGGLLWYLDRLVIELNPLEDGELLNRREFLPAAPLPVVRESVLSGSSAGPVSLVTEKQR